MSMSEKCLRNVILYLEPNLRIQLASQCPAFPEKEIPIHIAELCFFSCCVQINNTSYTLESKLMKDTLPEIVENFVAAPDEIVCPSREVTDVEKIRMSWEMGTIVNKRYEISRIRNEEERLRKHDALNKRAHKYQVEMLQFLARKHDMKSWISMDSIDSSSPDPKPTIEFSVLNPLGNNFPVHKEVLSCNRKIHEAQKYLLGKLLGGRPVIYAKSFRIYNSSVLRIPNDLRIRVKHLSIEGKKSDELLKRIQRILHSSSFPLESLKTSADCKFDNPIHQNCRLLILDYGSGLSKLQPYSHRKVLATHYGHGRDDISTIVKYWVENGQEIGTEYTFEFEKIFPAKVFMEDVREDYKGRILAQSNEAPVSITLPMKGGTELLITCEEIQNRDNKLDIKLVVQQGRIF